MPSIPRCRELRSPVAVTADRERAGVEEIKAVLAELPSVVEVAPAQGPGTPPPRVELSSPNSDNSTRLVPAGDHWPSGGGQVPRIVELVATLIAQPPIEVQATPHRR